MNLDVPAIARRPMCRRDAARDRAFSLVEMLIVLFLVAIVLAGLMILFSRTTYIARTQADLSTLQQGLRVAHNEIAHNLRMAGSGGLPISWTTFPPDLAIDYTTVGSFPNGFAIRLEDNVADGTTIGGQTVVPGSDVLTMRGSFTTPVYYLATPVNVASMITGDEILSGGGSIVVRDNIFETFRFSLDPLVAKVNEAIAANRAMALILRDLTNPDAYFIAQLDPATTTGTTAPCGDFTCLTIGIKFSKSESGSKAKEFGNLSFGTILEETTASAVQLGLPVGATKPELNVPRQIASIAVLEEFRYYLRTDFEVPNDTSTRFRPVLARAEFVPGTNDLIDRIDIADGIIDFQVAVGIETDSIVGELGFGEIRDTGGNDDEVLFNSPEDVLEDAPELAGHTPAVWYNPELEFHFLRLTTLAESKVPNLNFWTPGVETIENHDLRDTVNVGVSWTPSLERRFPRSYMQTVVEMRNLK